MGTFTGPKLLMLPGKRIVLYFLSVWWFLRTKPVSVSLMLWSHSPFGGIVIVSKALWTTCSGVGREPMGRWRGLDYVRAIDRVLCPDWAVDGLVWPASVSPTYPPGVRAVSHPAGSISTACQGQPLHYAPHNTARTPHISRVASSLWNKRAWNLQFVNCWDIALRGELAQWTWRQRNNRARWSGKLSDSNQMPMHANTYICQYIHTLYMSSTWIALGLYLIDCHSMSIYKQ